VDVTYPDALPDGLNKVSSSELNNTYSVDFTVLFENDTIVFQFDGKGSTNVRVAVTLLDDQANGPIADAAGAVELAGFETKWIQFAAFPARADGSAMASCNRHIVVTNLDDADQGCSVYQATYV
jgi:hypothetical protein